MFVYKFRTTRKYINLNGWRRRLSLLLTLNYGCMSCAMERGASIKMPENNFLPPINAKFSQKSYPYELDGIQSKGIQHLFKEVSDQAYSMTNILESNIHSLMLGTGGRGGRHCNGYAWKDLWVWDDEWKGKQAVPGTVRNGIVTQTSTYHTENKVTIGTAGTTPTTHIAADAVPTAISDIDTVNQFTANKTWYFEQANDPSLNGFVKPFPGIGS
jgi:hypothetical protein